MLVCHKTYSGVVPVCRSDKAFMTSNEIEAKQRQQKELQLELDRQVQEKKRQKVRGRPDSALQCWRGCQPSTCHVSFTA